MQPQHAPRTYPLKPTVNHHMQKELPLTNLKMHNQISEQVHEELAPAILLLNNWVSEHRFRNTPFRGF